MAPLVPLVEMQPQSLVYVALCCFAFLVGSRFANILSIRPRNSRRSPVTIKRYTYRLFFWMFALGALGNLLRLYDKYILRGAGGLSGMEAREALIDSSASSFSMLGAVLYPFGYIPLFLYMGSRLLPRSNFMFISALLLFLVPALDALVLFSRSFMLVSISMIYFGASISLFQGRSMPRKIILPMSIAIGIVIFLSAYFFSLRLEEMQLSTLDSVLMSGYGYTITPNEAASVALQRSDAGAKVLSMLLPLAQYFTHSMFEFQILWENAQWQTHSNGSLHFFPYVKAMSLFGLATLPDQFQLFPRVGIFTSFFGPLWVDFGWFGIFVMLIFGMLCRNLGRLAQMQDVGVYPLYAYLCIVLFFAPVVNFVISAQGIYNLTAFTVFFFLSRKLARNPVSSYYEALPSRT